MFLRVRFSQLNLILQMICHFSKNFQMCESQLFLFSLKPAAFGTQDLLIADWKHLRELYHIFQTLGILLELIYLRSGIHLNHVSSFALMRSGFFLLWTSRIRQSTRIFRLFISISSVFNICWT